MKHKLEVADTAVRIAKRPARSIHRSSTGEIECTPKLPNLAANALVTNAANCILTDPRGFLSSVNRPSVAQAAIPAHTICDGLHRSSAITLPSFGSEPRPTSSTLPPSLAIVRKVEES